jgi:hypothetical protein
VAALFFTFHHFPFQMKKPVLIAPFLGCALLAFAQNNPGSLIKVHLDPYYNLVQTEFLRNEVSFVDYVFDRRQCDVQVQSIQEPAGNGATRFRYYFIGNGTFYGQNDTVVWHADPAENAGSVREKSLAAYKRGLLPYLLQSSLANAITYQIADTVINADTYDPWRRWTFNPRLQVSSNGKFFSDDNPLTGKTDNRIREINVRPSFDVFHIGRTWRFGFFSAYEYHQRKQTTLNESLNSKESNNNLLIESEAVYALSQHWSAGASSYFFSGKYNWQTGGALGLEYNIFPYRDFFRQNWLFGYYTRLQVGNGIASRLNHALFTSYTKIRPWGYLRAGAHLSVWPVKQEWTRFRFRSDVELALNLGKNVFWFTRLSGSYTNNEYGLSLLSNPLLVTSINARTGYYDFSCGVSYFFGSGYQNIVNPRFSRIGHDPNAFL